MAVAGIVIKGDFPDLNKVRQDLLGIADKRTNAVLLEAALKKAIQPALLRLRQVTPEGPTGNLLRAVSSKTKAYPKDGGAVGLIGYQRSGTGESESARGGTVRAGKDRAFHQWWVEFGTKPRTVPGGRRPTGGPKQRQYQRRSPTVPFQRTRRRNGKVITETVQGSGVVHKVQELVPTYIASSYNKLEEFKVTREGGQMQTDRPFAFFKKSNKPIQIPPMPAGGTARRPPVQTAFGDSQSQVAAILTQELKISYQRALDALTLRDSGSISGV